MVVGGLGGSWAWHAFPRTAPWNGLPEFLTPQDQFYDRFAGKRHEFKYWAWWLTQPRKQWSQLRGPSGPWSLRVHGLVDREFSLDPSQLESSAAKHSQVSYLKTLRCTGDNPWSRLMSNGLWTGIPLRNLLDEAGLQGGANMLRITSMDGFTASLSINELDGLGGRPTILATHLQGEPLSKLRGAPCRVIVPDRFGFKNVKWPTSIEVVSEEGIWGNHEEMGEGGETGQVTVTTKFLSPDIKTTSQKSRTSTGLTRFEGVAFGGTDRVAKVELRVDDGDWVPARLPRPEELDGDLIRSAPGLIMTDQWPMYDVWTPWQLDVELKPGQHFLSARLTTEEGHIQPEHDDDWSDGGSSWAWAEVSVS